MKPVKQTKFGPVEGNCFAACLASLLEVPIEEIKIGKADSPNWLENLQAFLKPKNLFFLEVRIDVAVNYPLYAMNGIYCIMSGRSPRIFEGHETVNHCIVGQLDYNQKENRVVYTALHDPHPDKTFLKPKTLWGLGFLIALDPSKPTCPQFNPTAHSETWMDVSSAPTNNPHPLHYSDTLTTP
jgi:hypothetical protein